MKDWNIVKLDNVALVGDGAHASIKRVKNGIKYLTSKNFNLDGLKLDKVDFISQEDYLKYFKDSSKALTKPQNNDILLSIIGTMGAPYLVKSNDVFGISSSVSILRPDPSIIEPLFLLYWIKSSYFQQSINSIKSGVAQSFLSLKMIKSLPCILPELPTQQKIADILSAYDDLIENNLKRIKLLEEQAQITYEEWFVRMRFPGFENTPIDKETGLPEGWEIKTLNDLGKIITGKTPSTSNKTYYGGNIPFIKTPNISGYPYVFETNEYLSEEGSNIQKVRLLPKNSLVVSCIGSAGEYALVAKDSQFNQQINAIKFSKEYYTFYTYCYAKYLKPHLNALGSNGATMTNVNKGKFEKIKITLPSKEYLINFHNLASSNFELIYNIMIQNQRLKEARDILLPRLMMGIIEVK